MNRMSVGKLQPPVIPFMPLLLKDMTFAHEGNKTSVDGLVNFEKMHMMASTMRAVRFCRSRHLGKSCCYWFICIVIQFNLSIYINSFGSSITKKWRWSAVLHQLFPGNWQPKNTQFNVQQNWEPTLNHPEQ